MAVLDGLDAGGHVGNAAHRQDFHPQIVAGHGVGHGAHAHRVGPQGREGPDLGGGLIAGAHKAQVNALFVLDAKLIGHLARQSPQAGVKHLGHIGETGAEPLIVGPDEGVCAHHVDIIVDQHQGARLKAPVNAAGRVGQHHLLHPQQLEDVEGIADLLHGIALVEVEPPLQGQHLPAVEFACQQGALVARHAGQGEMRNLGVGDLLGVGKIGGQVAQARAQNHRDLGLARQPGPDKFGALPRLFVQLFHNRKTLLFKRFFFIISAGRRAVNAAPETESSQDVHLLSASKRL